MTPKELVKFIKVCRKHGVSQLEVGGVKVVLDPSFSPSRRTKAPTAAADPIPTDPPIDEETLALWSAA